MFRYIDKKIYQEYKLSKFYHGEIEKLQSFMSGVVLSILCGFLYFFVKYVFFVQTEYYRQLGNILFLLFIFLLFINAYLKEILIGKYIMFLEDKIKGD